ncbi:39S ribosomal protein L10, mitochondrial [Alosa sapidissima]|uniref:39S ribosomal protein L10, mitochondrial n=1 Tax=Alosa sapidissima TaxID=34773 RepID=UPI001C0A1B5E|nr:39S ribosomal protein L10, mitochondrial [Alosa sapidissima]
MAATLCGKLFSSPAWLPLTQSVRHGSKAVTRHRKPLHILKQKMIAVTKYIPPKPGPPAGSLAPRPKRIEEESGLMRILKRDLEDVFRDNKMVAVAQNSSSNSEDMLVLKHRLKKHDISVKFFPNQVARAFLPGSPYKNMEPLFMGPTVLLVSKEPKAKQMLLALRGSPQIALLGACIENTLLSRQGVLDYSKLPTVLTMQGELVSSLTLMTSQTVSMLQRHPAHLSALLQQYIKQLSPEVSAEQAPTQPTEAA